MLAEYSFSLRYFSACEPVVFSILRDVSIQHQGTDVDACSGAARTHFPVQQRGTWSTASFPWLAVDVGHEEQEVHCFYHVVIYGLVGRCRLNLKPSSLAQCPDFVGAVGLLLVGVTCDTANKDVRGLEWSLECCNVRSVRVLDDKAVPR